MSHEKSKMVSWSWVLMTPVQGYLKGYGARLGLMRLPALPRKSLAFDIAAPELDHAELASPGECTVL